MGIQTIDQNLPIFEPKESLENFEIPEIAEKAEELKKNINEETGATDKIPTPDEEKEWTDDGGKKLTPSGENLDDLTASEDDGYESLKNQNTRRREIDLTTTKIQKLLESHLDDEDADERELRRRHFKFKSENAINFLKIPLLLGAETFEKFNAQKNWRENFFNFIEWDFEASDGSERNEKIKNIKKTLASESLPRRDRRRLIKIFERANFDELVKVGDLLSQLGDDTRNLVQWLLAREAVGDISEDRLERQKFSRKNRKKDGSDLSKKEFRDQQSGADLIDQLQIWNEPELPEKFEISENEKKLIRFICDKNFDTKIDINDDSKDLYSARQLYFFLTQTLATQKRNDQEPAFRSSVGQRAQLPGPGISSREDAIAQFQKNPTKIIQFRNQVRQIMAIDATQTQQLFMNPDAVIDALALKDSAEITELKNEFLTKFAEFLQTKEWFEENALGISRGFRDKMFGFLSTMTLTVPTGPIDPNTPAGQIRVDLQLKNQQKQFIESAIREIETQQWKTPSGPQPTPKFNFGIDPLGQSIDTQFGRDFPVENKSGTVKFNVGFGAGPGIDLRNGQIRLSASIDTSLAIQLDHRQTRVANIRNARSADYLVRSAGANGHINALGGGLSAETELARQRDIITGLNQLHGIYKEVSTALLNPKENFETREQVEKFLDKQVSDPNFWDDKIKQKFRENNEQNLREDFSHIKSFLKLFKNPDDDTLPETLQNRENLENFLCEIQNGNIDTRRHDSVAQLDGKIKITGFGFGIGTGFSTQFQKIQKKEKTKPEYFTEKYVGPPLIDGGPAGPVTPVAQPTGPDAPMHKQNLGWPGNPGIKRPKNTPDVGEIIDEKAEEIDALRGQPFFLSMRLRLTRFSNEYLPNPGDRAEFFAQLLNNPDALTTNTRENFKNLDEIREYLQTSLGHIGGSLSVKIDQKKIKITAEKLTDEKTHILDFLNVRVAPDEKSNIVINTNEIIIGNLENFKINAINKLNGNNVSRFLLLGKPGENQEYEKVTDTTPGFTESTKNLKSIELHRTARQLDIPGLTPAEKQQILDRIDSGEYPTLAPLAWRSLESNPKSPAPPTERIITNRRNFSTRKITKDGDQLSIEKTETKNEEIDELDTWFEAPENLDTDAEDTATGRTAYKNSLATLNTGKQITAETLKTFYPDAKNLEQKSADELRRLATYTNQRLAMEKFYKTSETSVASLITARENNGESVGLGYLSNEKLKTKFQTILDTRKKDNENPNFNPENRDDNFQNLIGFTAFYRYGEGAHRGFSMTAPGETAPLQSFSQKIEDNEDSDGREEAQSRLIKKFENNENRKSLLHQTLTKTLDNKFSAQEIDNETKQKILKKISENPENLFSTDGFKIDEQNEKNMKIKFSTTEYFYLLAECANESIGFTIDEISITGTSTENIDRETASVGSGTVMIGQQVHSAQQNFNLQARQGFIPEREASQADLDHWDDPPRDSDPDQGSTPSNTGANGRNNSGGGSNGGNVAWKTN